ncbi:outer membrane lipid asymmetry maintenance protein MlaD [Kordiimonas aquimaris]|uniref:outer membrane lipid asymmetry maintenance protein MlaD n=1 Tax=Kordiimonas aquimaris TaxID=707591 RepID=UPI0021D1117E|nr:outer membrane lipid asymmetry maintenance protein MlaD [Kordiimonas aquimaris]
MSSNLVESLIGALVLLVAGWFLVFAYERTDMASSDGYILSARFDRIDGLGVGSDVRMAGIKVGTIVESKLDPKTYQAVVKFSVDAGVILPADTAAAVTAEGLLGGTYMNLSPGGMEETLLDGDEISETQDAVDLLGLIGKFIYGGGDDKPQ